MRTHLVTLAATLTVMGFATTAVAATAATMSGGGAPAVSAPSAGGGFSSSSSGSSSSGSSSNSSTSSSSGAAHSGGGAPAQGGWSGGRGAGFTGHSGFNGYGTVASSGRDIAHGGYQVVGVRPANVPANVVRSTTTTETHSLHNSLELGPRLGSAAKAATLLADDKHHRPGPGGYPHHPHRINQAGLADYVRFENCAPNNACQYGMPQELCPYWSELASDPWYCTQPRKLPAAHPKK